jgi:FKBP-type peptidyl-prolyl cis-trans isomerase FkpA
MANQSRWRFPSFVRLLAVLACLGIGAPGTNALPPGAPSNPPGAVTENSGAPPPSPADLAREKARGKAYLDKAAKEKGAVRTKSGMVFIPLREGKGTTPRAESLVQVAYQTSRIDGKVIESSAGRKAPLEVPIADVIPCWQHGLLRMRVGQKARLVCPPELAFGDRTAPGVFPGGSTLVYELELLKVVR